MALQLPSEQLNRAEKSSLPLLFLAPLLSINGKKTKKSVRPILRGSRAENSEKALPFPLFFAFVLRVPRPLLWLEMFPTHLFRVEKS